MFSKSGNALCMRDVFYIGRVVDLMKTANFKVNPYIMYIFGKIELLSDCNLNYFKMHFFNDFQEAKTYLYIGHWKYGRTMTFMDLVSGRTLETIIARKLVHSHTQLLKIWLQIKDTKCYNII